MDTVARWGSHTRDGGYYWSTYKATCRRDGHYTGGRRGEVAFNGDLARPIFDLISTTWDQLFNTTAMQFISCAPCSRNASASIPGSFKCRLGITSGHALVKTATDLV